ncbi:MAG: aminoglycoside phosphotransferase family protein [Myxococcota bacterium]
MTEAPFTAMAPLERLVEMATGTTPPLALEEIMGGGSVRRFFRVRTQDGGSVVAMYAPSHTHEVGSDPASRRPWPFLEVRDLLEEHGVRVPKLVGAACHDGLILVEDLGETLAQHLVRAPEDREHLYKVAVRDLGRAQRSLSPVPATSIVRGRAFDERLLRWEIDHFKEWALDARGIHLSAHDAAVFDRAAAHLARLISDWPRGFVHRDYQSRNLMVVRNSDGKLGLGWIDFQDAMLGPRVYDIVALLNDSYQSFTRDFIEARLDEFTAHLGLDSSERARIGREFRVVTVQRKLKDAGRFVFFDRNHRNPAFLRFVEPTIEKARAALRELTDDPILAELGALLERIPEPSREATRSNSVSPS